MNAPEAPQTQAPLIDVEDLLSRLKPFQRATVDHAFRRLWTDDDAVDRFLVADEVGLGKTLIAKGVAARAIDTLSKRKPSVTIVYICSNNQIARQNLERLRELTGGQAQQNAGRITMLPQTMGRAAAEGVNLIAFTPGTSLRLGNATGRVEERALLHWMLSHIVDRLWLMQEPVIDYFRGGVGYERFASRLESDGSKPTLDEEQITDFAHHVRTEPGPFGGTLLEDLLGELDHWLAGDPFTGDSFSGDRLTDEANRRRTAMIGELRMTMAHTAVSRLAPDLVILDEFQRFKDLFPGASSGRVPDQSDAQRLAQKIITNKGAKSLVLSATPYKMFTLPDELDEEDHYQDFHDTIGFLAGPERARRVAQHLADVRRGMLRGTDEGRRTAQEATRVATAELQRVMSRTERLGATAVSDGMLQEMAIPPLELRSQDLEVWTANDRIGRHSHGLDMFEYWRSSPYPVNLMDPSAYLAHHRVLDKAKDQDGELAALLRAHRRGLLSWRNVREFRVSDPGNPKLRAMTDAAMDRGVWKLAWLPPSLPYVTPGGPFAAEGARTYTKRLVFSAWGVVPKAIAALFSYEVDRRLSEFSPRQTDGSPTRYDSSRSTRPLDFAVTDGKLQNLPHLALLHPSTVLARIGDPLEIARELGEELPIDRDRLVEIVEARIQQKLDALDLPTGEKDGQTSGWYGVAPYLLDQTLDLKDPGLRGVVDERGEGEEAASRYGDHVAFALAPDLETLGAPPDDLAHVLAKIAVAGPGVCALRALSRATGEQTPSTASACAGPPSAWQKACAPCSTGRRSGRPYERPPTRASMTPTATGSGSSDTASTATCRRPSTSTCTPSSTPWACSPTNPTTGPRSSPHGSAPPPASAPPRTTSMSSAPTALRSTSRCTASTRTSPLGSDARRTPIRLTTARPAYGTASTHRSGLSSSRVPRWDRRAWTSTPTAMRSCIGTCPAIPSTWSSAKDACTGTKATRSGRTSPTGTARPRSPKTTRIHGPPSSTLPRPMNRTTAMA
ncbi:MAG TPA: hypothetical protein VK053_03925 [Jiangellaceae bacterium]|nr:hypothetical protein [Jiangellaceae bacterium]